MTGFEVVWSTSAGSQTRTFGDCSTGTFTTFPVGQELMHFARALDTDDVEGIAFIDAAQTVVPACAAHPSTFDLVNDTPQCAMTLQANPTAPNWSA